MRSDHYYEPISPDVIPDCCSEPSPDDPTCSDCCYDVWKEELKKLDKKEKKRKQQELDTQEAQAQAGKPLDADVMSKK